MSEESEIQKIIDENKRILGPSFVEEMMKNPTFWKRFIFKTLPQGKGSGLDADTVDGYHADDFLQRLAVKHLAMGGGGVSDHGALTGLADDNHTQYLNVTRHDITDRHALGTVVPHDALASLTEKSHANLTNITTDQHHAESHTLASHSQKKHSDLTDIGTDDHHAQAHTLASHSTKAHNELTGLSADDHTQYLKKTPDYDSGWTAIAQDEIKTFTHNLGTGEYLVNVEAKDGAGIIHQKWYGGYIIPTSTFILYYLGFYYMAKEINTIQVKRLATDIDANYVRVILWKTV